MEETILRKLKYGNTNTFFISGYDGGLLVDTDYAGTMEAFYRELKKNGLGTGDIRYVMATHYHPDHMGLAGNIAARGAELLLLDVQREKVHFSDYIFKRDKLPFCAIKEEDAKIISVKESRNFLKSIGIKGEIISTPSHSPDSVSLILDDGDCIVGDLEPREYISAYEDNEMLKNDWNNIMSFNPKRILYAHMPEKII